MKRTVLSIVIFIIAFVLMYLFLCYSPLMRIRLGAGPWEYFVESVKYSYGFKIVASVVTGLIFALIPMFVVKLKFKYPNNRNKHK